MLLITMKRDSNHMIIIHMGLSETRVPQNPMVVIFSMKGSYLDVNPIVRHTHIIQVTCGNLLMVIILGTMNIE